MSVLVLGLNYRTAPVGLLERMAVPAERLPKALASLTNREHVLEALVLSTCNRVEVYAHVTRYHGGMADLRNFFSEWGGVAPEDFAGLTYDYYEDRAAAHLFGVASGLDSMVVGERQIHLQVKQAFKDAQANGTCRRLLHSLFRRALRAAKRTRAETGISTGASSMVDVGLDAARHVLGDLQDRTVLIVGAGKMGGMAASRLQPLAGRILVANRTPEKGARLADRVGAEVVRLHGLDDGLTAADLVLSSTGAVRPVVDFEQVKQAMAHRTHRPLVLLDLAVPRDVDPACAGLPGVTVLNIESIRALTGTDPRAGDREAAQGRRWADGPAGRLPDEVAKARQVVEEEAACFAAWTRAVGVEPTIAALRSHAEAIRVAEIGRLSGRFADLDDKQRAALDALTKRIVNTLLHDPSVRLKAIADARGGDLYASTLRELFDLPE